MNFDERDVLAMLAMHGMLSRDSYGEAACAKRAYQMADAMLAEREKNKK